MKPFILFLQLFFVAMFVQAQIVITNNDLANPGAAIVQAVDTVPDTSIVPGPAGADQMWDFSALVDTYTGMIRVRQPDWTPFGDDFPDANYCMEQDWDDTVYIMMDRTTSEFSIVGMVGVFSEILDTTVIIRMNPRQVIAEFPVEYLDKRVDTNSYQFIVPSNVPPVDSIKLKFVNISDILVDAWGTLTIPLGTFDVLRIYEYQFNIDSVFAKIAGQWIFQDATLDTSINYTWWSDDDATGIYLADMEIIPGSKEEVAQVLYLKSYPTYGIDDHQEGFDIVAFPNPAGDRISFRTGTDTRGTIEILDIMGKILIKVACGQEDDQRLSVGNLSPGLYLYRIVDDNHFVIHHGKFLKD